MGVTTGWGGGVSLVRAVGYPRAIDLLMSGRKLDFHEGTNIGYFNGEVSKEESVKDANLWLLDRIEHCDPLLVRNTKAILRQEIEISDEHYEIPNEEFSARLFAELWHGPSHQKALTRNPKHR
jgi:enoyl-CoA hydratase/carnithine racemase